MASGLLLHLIFIFIFIASMVFIFRRKSKHTALNLPPGPPRLPLLGNFHQLKLPLHKSLRELSKKYGDLMFLRIGAVPTIVISSSDIVSEVCKLHDITFSSRPLLHVPWKLEYDGLGLSFAKYGSHWREFRKIVALELLSMKKVQSFETVREEEVAHLLSSIAAAASSPVNMNELIHIMSNNIICRAAFGTKLYGNGHAKTEKTYYVFQEMAELLGATCISDFFPWMRWINKVNGFDAKLGRIIRDLDELFSGFLEEHRKARNFQDEDLVDVLLQLQRKSDNSEAFSDDLIKALIMDIFVAGTDTSSATVVWAMAELIRNPWALKKAQEEVRKVVNPRSKVEEKNLKDLQYLKMVIKETLRLHPVVPLLLPRETIEACEIRRFHIPAKTMVFINAQAITMDERTWEKPYEFRPERFINSPVDFKGQHFEFIPFGFGRRICPGINFGLTIIELALASLLYHFDWNLPDDQAAENLDMEEALGLTVHKKNPLLLVATSKRASDVGSE